MSARLDARSQLDEYLRQIRETNEYRVALDATGDANAECARILADAEFAPNTFAAWYADDDPSGDVWRRSSGFPIAPRWVDAPFGSLVWEHHGDPDRRRQVFKMSFVEVWRDWRGYGVEHTLHPDGSGCVWLGECNNSAREDISDPAEAWAVWCARRALDAASSDDPYLVAGGGS